MIDFKKVNTFAQFIEEAGKRYQDRTALIWRPRFRALKFTYRELWQLSCVFARFLEEKRFKKGERIILAAANSPWWVAAFFGCQLKGIMVVPLASQNTAEFVGKISRFTEAKLILRNKDLEEIFGNWKAKPVDFQEEKTSPNDITEILFTSGTTGEPKGTELRHSNILSNIKAVSSLSIGLISHKDRLLTFLPLSHIFSQVAGLFIPFSFGLPITLAAQVSGLHIRMNLQEDQPTIMTAVPEFLKLALKRIEEKAKEQGQLKKLQLLYKLAPYLPIIVRRLLAQKILNQFGGKLITIVSGGAALDPKVGRKWEAFGIYVIQGYGATETSPIVSVNRFKGRKIESVGPLIPGVEVKIAADGEILVRGPNVVKGYFKNPEKTSQSFKDGWYFTDDLGFFDREGHLHILGRKKYLIVTPAGENVYPEDLEAKLNQEPEVADSAVVGHPEEDHFEIHAVLLPKIGLPLNGEEIIRRVNEKLEPHQRIQGVSIWPEEDFPRTLTKKVKKEVVLQWLKKKQKPKEPSKSPAIQEIEPLERILANITGFPAVEITPEKRLVTDLKMDSLSRVTLVATVEEDLGVVLDEAMIVPETTVQTLKEKISRKEQKEERYPFLKWPLSRTTRWLRTLVQYLLVWPIITFSSRLKVEGITNFAEIKKGPVLFYSNHLTIIDAGFLLRAVPLRFRTKTAIASASDIVFEDPKIKRWAKPLLFLGNIYPFSRYGQIKSSLEYTGRLVDRGFSIIFFPEGRLPPTAELQPLKEGAGLVAIEMGVPVVPVIISGTRGLVPAGTTKFLWWKRPKITVTFGKSMIFTAKDSISEITQQIEESLRKLQHESA